MTDEVVVRCHGLVKLYPAACGETQALRGVEAVFRRGTLSAVTGPSGSGKTSLLSILALKERHTAGDLQVLGRTIASLRARQVSSLRRRHVAWVPQRPSEALLPSLRVHEQLETTASLRRRAVDHGALERLSLDHRRNARVHELSGGEQQRLAVLVATGAGASLVVADEPTAELDDATAGLVLDELVACAASGACVVVGTHDDRVVRRVDRVLALRHGVLSTEQRSGRTLVPIDSAGRLQLPPDALALLAGDRVDLLVDADQVILRRPDGDEAR